jgi:hypothetical protein
MTSCPSHLWKRGYGATSSTGFRDRATRAGELLGRPAYDHAGRRLGRVIDIVAHAGGPHGRLRLHGLVVAPHWYGRLVGVDGGTIRGPWLVAVMARLLRHGSRTVPVSAVRFDPPVPGFPTGSLSGTTGRSS